MTSLRSTTWSTPLSAAPPPIEATTGTPPPVAITTKKPQEPADHHAGTERRLDRASKTLETYLASTRYPPDSRPAGERPDMIEPHRVPVRELPIAPGDDGARVVLFQDRYLVAAGERITLRIGCMQHGERARCEDVSAPVEFHEDEDGAQTSVIVPSSSKGLVSVDVRLSIGGTVGKASFDFEVTPVAPATFAEFSREYLEDGSLVVPLRVTVEKPGRYVIRGRAKDARGETFAFLTYNGVLERGAAIVPLRLFGKLVRDEGAEAPFEIRDLEGFLLLEDVYPDREAMPSIDGPVHTTAKYPASAFAPDAWTSPEKTRHIADLEAALDRASD